MSVASEISTAALIRMAERDGKRCYVPVLHPWQPHTMAFVLYKAGGRLRRNRWGIAEPALGLQNQLAADQFDLVMMPLLAFDQQGRRLGMGQGFYDRAFAFRRDTRCKPLLLGPAMACARQGFSSPAPAGSTLSRENRPSNPVQVQCLNLGCGARLEIGNILIVTVLIRTLLLTSIAPGNVCGCRCLCRS